MDEIFLNQIDDYIMYLSVCLFRLNIASNSSTSGHIAKVPY